MQVKIYGSAVHCNYCVMKESPNDDIRNTKIENGYVVMYSNRNEIYKLTLLPMQMHVDS